MTERKLKGIAALAVILCIVLTISLVYAVFEIRNLNEIANLQKSKTWIDETFNLVAYHEIDRDFVAPYAGLVEIKLESSNPNVTANLKYTISTLFDNQFGTNGWQTFPVSPSNVRISLNAYDVTQGSTARLLVKYTY